MHHVLESLANQQSLTWSWIFIWKDLNSPISDPMAPYLHSVSTLFFLYSANFKSNFSKTFYHFIIVTLTVTYPFSFVVESVLNVFDLARQLLDQIILVSDHTLHLLDGYLSWHLWMGITADLVATASSHQAPSTFLGTSLPIITVPTLHIQEHHVSSDTLI